LILQFGFTAANRLFIQTRDERQLSVTGTIAFFCQCRHVPTPLWFIQPTHEEVDPLMAFYDLHVKPVLTSLASTLVYDWFDIHVASIADVREVINLLTLSFLAATMPATPTGFWDRKPKRTPGRFRRTLAGRPFPEVANLSGRLRKKNSITAHLPKGHLARMAKNAPAAPVPALH
jgi:hypothetical protein